MQVADEATTVIQADHRHDFLTPADDHRSPLLEVEWLEGNAGQRAEELHGPFGNGRRTADTGPGTDSDHHGEPSRVGVKQADQPLHVTPLADRDEAFRQVGRVGFPGPCPREFGMG